MADSFNHKNQLLVAGCLPLPKYYKNFNIPLGLSTPPTYQQPMPTTATTPSPPPGAIALRYYNARPEHIDELVTIEIKQLKHQYTDEEERYVERMLIEQPVEDVRRTMPTRASFRHCTTTTTESSSSSASCSPRESQLQQQRAESCRKSRYNNKIKKAKLRFRHKFVSNQMAENANVLDYLRTVIAQTEKQLLAHGYVLNELDRLRRTFGVATNFACGIDIMANE